jgi:hypothetical protein
VITVRMKRTNEDGSTIIVRVTAKDLVTAARLVPGSVIFPIDGDEFFYGSGPEDFHSVDVLEGAP